MSKKEQFVSFKPRTVSRVLRAATRTIVDSFRSIGALKRKDDERFYEIIRGWVDYLLDLYCVKTNVIGRENISPNEKYIFASNHNTYFDIPVVLSALGERRRIIYKKELEKIPFFGAGLRASPFVAIERASPRKAMQSLEKALETIRAGESVIIFPEGTRSPDGKLGAFRRGAFYLAARAGKPIVPVIMKGTPEILPDGFAKNLPQVVDVQIGEPIDTSEVVDKKSEKALMKLLREKMQSMLD